MCLLPTTTTLLSSSVSKLLGSPLFASLWLEASVVMVVNTVFLILFVAAGVRQIIKDKQES